MPHTALRPERRLVGIPRHAHGRIPETWKQLRSDFKWDNDKGMPNATLNILKDVVFNAQGRKMALANLKGSGTYHGTGTLTIGNDDDVINFSGSFT